MSPTDDIVEDESNNRPGNIIHSTGRRDRTGPTEDNGEVDVFDRGVGPLPADQISCRRTQCTNKEEEYEAAGCRISSVMNLI